MNHKKVYRLYRQAGLAVPKRKRRKGVATERQPLVLSEAANQTWCRFRDECLNEHWFQDLAHARDVIHAWRRDYNEHRPHSALDYMTPLEFAAQHRTIRTGSTPTDITK